MKVTIINHSDTRGGASVVTLRLLEALQRKGIDARMLVVHKGTDNESVAVAAPKWRVKWCFAREHIDILLHNGFSRKTLFKISTGAVGLPLHNHPWVQDADVIMLNWVNQGMLSLDEIYHFHEMGKPVVWTMHDMWCLTGVCHHAGLCRNYENSCGLCPLLYHGKKADDLSHKVWQHKDNVYSGMPIHFVAVSRWLADRCASSALMKHQRVSVIHNAFPIHEFGLKPQLTRKQIGVPEKKRLVVMGAARLDDPIKGLPYAIEALNILADDPKFADNTEAVFYGSIKERRLLDAIRLPHTYLGTVSDKRILQSVYAHASVVLSTSMYETLPGTLIEGQASGCLPVTFGQGGQPDIVDHLANGYIARYLDSTDVANGIRWALNAKRDRNALHNCVATRFGADAIADKYISLFENILSKNDNKPSLLSRLKK